MNGFSIPGIPSLAGLAVFRNVVTILIGQSASKMVDVTKSLPPMSMLSIHFEDPISFQADTLELTFVDIGDQIIKSKQAKKGMWMKVKINQYNRDYPLSYVQRDLGSFQIDQIKTRWPPTQVTLMASSVPISEQIKLTLQNKTRFTLTLRNLAEQVAKENHLEFKWAVNDSDPRTAGARASNRIMMTASQWNESDLQMLSRYLRENGLSFKIKDIKGKQTLVVFDEQELEKGPPVYTIDFSLPGAGIALERGELTTQSQDIYAGSQLAWFDTNTNQAYIGVAKAPPETADGTKEIQNSTDIRQNTPTGSGEDVNQGE